MNQLLREIERLSAVITEQDRLIPHMPIEHQAYAKQMRNWEVRILGEYQRRYIFA